MIESLTELLKTLSTLSPIAVIALLATVLYVVVRKQPSTEDFRRLTTNDLHELPEMAATLRRIEVTLSDNFAHLRAMVDRRGSPR